MSLAAVTASAYGASPRGWAGFIDRGDFVSQLLHTAIPQRAASGTTATFTRATTKTVENNDGYLVTLLAGEIGFVGARRVRNHFTFTEALTNAAWVKSGATVTASPELDPDGGTRAFRVQLNGGGLTYVGQSAAFPVGNTTLPHFYVKSNTDGDQTFRIIADGGIVNSTDFTATQAWQRFDLLVPSTTQANDLYGIREGSGLAAADLLVALPQLEDVTAQTAQTAGEYVSVGVESTPYYHGSFVDGVKCFPTDINGVPLTTMERYKPELAATNVLFKSNTLNDAAWANAGTVTVTQNVTGVDGATSAWTINDTDAAIASYRQQSKTLTAADWTQSCKVKKTTGAQTYYPVWFAYSSVASKIALCTIDTTNGVVTVWTAFTGLTIATSSARCTSFNADYWLVELTFLATANLYEVCGFSPVGADTATKSTGVLVASQQGSKVAQQFQCELGSKATSYIDNTSAVAVVTRNKDELTYFGGDIPNLKTLSATFKRESGVSSVGVIAALSNGTINEYAAPTMQSATNMRFEGVDGGVLQWATSASNAYAAGATSKVVQSTATNDIKMAKDGVGQSADTTATLPTIDRLDVGHLTGSYQLSGNVGPIYGWTRNLSQSELNAITS